MIVVKEKFFDRFDQAFKLFKNNFIWLFFPFFIYNFISVVIVWTLTKYYLMVNIKWINNLDWLDFFSFLNNSTVVMWIIIGTILYIIYLLLYIVVFLWLIKSFRQIFNWEKITMTQNIKYGLSSFISSMKTYWFIFAYIALIPAIIFIIWWIFFNLSYFLWNYEYLQKFWWALMNLSLIIFIWFSVYRWTKATFAIYSAVDKDSFTKNNFNNSIKITDNNWWRILGNIMLIWIMLSWIASLVSWFVWSILFFSSWWSSLIEEIIVWFNGHNINSLKDLLNTYFNNYSIFTEILSNTLNNIISTISKIFILLFTYLFFKRLENKENSVSLKEDIDIELY